jgi:putative tryptophan/tyrosine transport system substrate-binding protein
VPRLARAQPDTRVRRLAILVAGDENQTNTGNFAVFRDELARLGWVEGRNLQIDMRYDRGDVDRMRANAAELVGLAPDVIFANGNNATIVKEQTQTIPIVLGFAGDVSATGLVKNLAHPEGNITGITNFFTSVGGKWVELLKEAVPRMERVGYIYNPQLLLPGGLAEEVEKASQLLALRTNDQHSSDPISAPDHLCYPGRPTHVRTRRYCGTRRVLC